MKVKFPHLLFWMLNQLNICCCVLIEIFVTCGTFVLGMRLKCTKWLWIEKDNIQFGLILLVKSFLLSVMSIYMTNTQHKRSASGRESAMHRDSQLSMLQRDAFFAYIQKIKVSVLFSFSLVLMWPCVVDRIFKSSEVWMSGLCYLGIVWEPVREASSQTIGQGCLSTVVSACRATLGWSLRVKLYVWAISYKKNKSTGGEWLVEPSPKFLWYI